jgi:hypothetical protein
MPRALTALRSSLRVVAISGSLLFGGLLPSAAFAQNPASAIAHAEEGERAFADGDFAVAYEAFQKANQMLSAPTVVVRMADCKRELGELVKARDLYRWAEAWQLPDPAPPPWVAATARAEEERTKIEPRLGTLRVVVEGTNQPVTVWVDGTIVDAAALVEMPIDPGNHEVVAEGAGRSETGTIAVAEGQFESVVLNLSPGGPPELNTPALITMGAGGGALIIAIATGVASMVSVSDLQERCQPDGRCPLADKNQADHAQRLADASTATFIVGGLALATGIGLLWLPLDDDGASALRVDVLPGGAQATFQF